MVAALVVAGDAQVAFAAEEPTPRPDRTASYYHFALGHLYHQFVKQTGRAEYADRAVKEYEEALAHDPDSVLIRMELMDIFAATNRLPRAVGIADQIFEIDPDNAPARRLLGNIYRSYSAENRRAPNKELLAKAIEQFERLTELEPESGANHHDLGRLLALAGNPTAATEKLRKALELEPGLSDARVSLAYILLESGQLEEAIGELEQIVEDGQSGRQHMSNLASAYEQVGRPRDAARLYQRLLREGGNTLEARKRLAENLYRSGEVEKALEQFQALTGIDQQEIGYHLRIAAIRRGMGQFEAAAEALEDARRIDPESLQVKFEAVNLLVAQGQVEGATAELGALLQSTRKSEYPPNELRRRVMLLERLGALYREQGNATAAVNTFRQISELSPDLKPGVVVQIIETWRAERDYKRAEQEARQAVAEFDKDPLLANMLANILSDRGKTKEAVKAAQRMLRGGAPEIEVALARARIFEKAREFESAKQEIDRASELATSEQERISVLFAYGSMHERAKQYEQAEARFRELLAIAPNNSSALNYLGYMFADRGMHLDEAHDLIQRAVDIEPNNGAYLDSLGWVYFRQNKFDLAAKYLERSLEQYKDDPVVHSHLGDVYFKLGRVEDAKRHWNRGLQEWKRSAPAERDADEVEKLRRKLAELELSLADEGAAVKGKQRVKR